MAHFAKLIDWEWHGDEPEEKALGRLIARHYDGDPICIIEAAAHALEHGARRKKNNGKIAETLWKIRDSLLFPEL